MKSTLLLIEDDHVFQRLLLQQLDAMGFNTLGAGSWSDAQTLLAGMEPDAIILDYKLPDADATGILAELAGQCPVIVLTGYGSIKSAVEMIRLGAADYITKPVDLGALELTVRRVLENATIRQHNRFYREKLGSQRPGRLIGNSPAMRHLRQMIEAVAPTDTTVLILGESGTGKEMVAQMIHEYSTRAHGEMVPLDSCGLQESLFESELFGHEKGSFTGADRLKRGLVEEARGSTLFLDEIGDIGLPIQAKLLRFLESESFRRVGGTKILKADCRIIAATNRDIEGMCHDGSFRMDLYFRFSRFVITVPPLRARKDDIPDLASHFLNMHARAVPMTLSPEAIQFLTRHEWPGNIRELKNAVERAVILARPGTVINPEHLSFIHHHVQSGTLELDFTQELSLKEVEKGYLRQALVRYAGNRSKVASVLGISERNIYRLIRRYGLGE